MKCISIRQPWASLICAGIKNVENRSWQTKYRGKILIHASSFKCPKDWAYQLPLELSNESINNDIFGNIDIENIPGSAIIGYVNLDDCVTGNDNLLWSDPGSEYKFMLSNAYMFNEPITGVKGKLNIFDYPLDENNLPPAHKAKLREPSIKGKTITMPVADRVIENCKNLSGPKNIELYDTEMMLSTFYRYHDLLDKYVLRPEAEAAKSIRLIGQSGEELKYTLKSIETDVDVDVNGNPAITQALNGEEVEIVFTRFVFE